MEKKEKRGAKKKALKDKVSPVTITVKNSVIMQLGGPKGCRELLKNALNEMAESLN